MKKIVFCIDKNYLRPLASALQSFINYNTPHDYEIKILYSNIGYGDREKFVRYFETLELNIEFMHIDYDFSHIPVGYHFNSVIFYRFLIPSIFKNEDKILYLDSDILFLANIDEIFNLDIGNNVLAAISKSDITGIPIYLSDFVDKYFASGLLLFNPKEFISQGCFDKAMFYLNTFHYEMPDQDALNYAVKSSFDISYRYGIETAFLDQNNCNENLKNELKNIKIVQFSGSSKPWHFRNKHPYKSLYWKYLRMTPYKYSTPTDLTLLNILKWIVPEFVKSKLKRIFIREVNL